MTEESYGESIGCRAGSCLSQVRSAKRTLQGGRPGLESEGVCANREVVNVKRSKRIKYVTKKDHRFVKGRVSKSQDRVVVEGKSGETAEEASSETWGCRTGSWG